MSKRTPIDLTNLSSQQYSGVARYSRQSEATTFAKACGWKVSDTKLVRFRFQQLWVIAYEVPGSLVMLKSDKSTVEIPWDAKYI